MGVFATVYVILIVTAAGVAILLEDRYGINSTRTLLVFLGSLFLVSASGRPWWLYHTIRTIRWFALITSEAAMRLVLLALGAFCVLLGFFGRVG